MKIPKSINIGPYEVKIVWVKWLWHEEGCRGKFDRTSLIITLAEDMPEQYKPEVFFHEVLEAGKFLYDLGNFIHRDLDVVGMVLTQTLLPLMETEKEQGEKEQGEKIWQRFHGSK